jgi:putative molybdopterin biosynthesis protein
MTGIAGYTPMQSGEVLSMRRVLPWWDYSKNKETAGSPGSADTP